MERFWVPKFFDMLFFHSYWIASDGCIMLVNKMYKKRPMDEKHFSFHSAHYGLTFQIKPSVLLN